MWQGNCKLICVPIIGVVGSYWPAFQTRWTIQGRICQVGCPKPILQIHFFVFPPFPSIRRTSSRSSSPRARCSVLKDWMGCLVLRLIACLCNSICLHDTSRWNSLFSPKKHSGHCRIFPPFCVIKSRISVSWSRVHASKFWQCFWPSGFFNMWLHFPPICWQRHQLQCHHLLDIGDHFLLVLLM